MEKCPGVPSLVGISIGAFGVFTHGRFIVVRLAVDGEERFSVVAIRDYPAVGRSEHTDGPLLADFVL